MTLDQTQNPDCQFLESGADRSINGRTFVFIDMVGSSTFQATRAEDEWTAVFAGLHELIHSVAITTAKMKGAGDVCHVVKFTGDGAFLAFSKASTAFTFSVDFISALATKKRQGKTAIECTVGLATGNVLVIGTPYKDACDYLGTTVNNAAKLCKLASPNAIMISKAAKPDTTTMSEFTEMVGERISSMCSVSETLHKTRDSSGLEFYEFIYATERGTKHAHNERAAKQPKTWERKSEESPQGGFRSSTREDQAVWSKGVVKAVYSGFGFITGPNGEDFAYAPYESLAISSTVISNGDSVIFKVADSLENHQKYRRAVNIFLFGQKVKGLLTRSNNEAGYGFATVADAKGVSFTVFLNLGYNNTVSSGDTVEFEIGENPKGIAGFNVSKI